EPVSGSFAHFAWKYWGPFAGFLSGWNYWVMFVLVGMAELTAAPAPAKWHPEIDTGVHTLMTLSMAAMLSPQLDVRFATLCHDLG
ncbi:hypothetical protein MJM04_34930, partial [Salmonella enterica subsp. enterica serovar Cerro]|nr:hypothetical protein [Salmonella enterica subsp. enterica serovar Cerro]